MDSKRRSGRQKRNSKFIYKFYPSQITKVQPVGNSLRGTECPKPRSGHRIVAKDGNLYVFGGYTAIISGMTNVEHVLFKELWKYNIASKSWRLLETSGKVPELLASHCAILVGNNMFVFGGTGIPFGEVSNNNVYVCNLNTLEWVELETTGTPPPELYGQAMLHHDNKIFVVGGTNGFAYSIFVHCLDLYTNEWSHLDANMQPYDWVPEPRYRHELAIENDQLFVFGGGTAIACFGFDKVPVFNLVSNSWSKMQTSDEYPVARRCHASVQIGSDVYICGGFNGRRIYDDIWKLNLKSLQWQKLPVTLPQAVYFHSAAVTKEGRLFVFGGVNDILDNSRINELYSMWLKIPSLAEICWQAVMKYVPHVSQLQKRKLLEAGVPFHLIQEIDFESPFSATMTHCCNRLQS